MLILTMPFFATMSAAQGKRDEAAIRNILQEEAAAWNKGDAQPYSRDFAVDGKFTNILGMFFTGRHHLLTGTKKYLRKGFAELCFVRTSLRSGSSGLEAAVVERLTWVSWLSASGPPPGAFPDAKGRLRTRLLQVMVKRAGD